METKKTKLHLCCGSRNFGSDWVHIDGMPQPHLDYQIRDLGCLPFPDESFDLIYCSYAIGYFDREGVIPILKEWQRVLKRGGTLRLATPDFDAINYLYRKGEYKLDDLLGLLHGKWEFEGNNKKFIYFKTSYDFVSLRDLLKSVGFEKINLYDFRDTEHSEFDDHSKAHLPHIQESIDSGVFLPEQTLVSLNVECRKS